MPIDFTLPDDLSDVEVIYLNDDNVELDEDELNMDPEFEEDEEPPEDKAMTTFIEHNRSVFCVSVNPDSTLACTGGEDDLAYIWNIATGKVELECTGHKDSVTAASFSHDNKYLVTGDMGGLIQVWDVINKNLVWCYEADEMEWLIWHRSAHVLIAGFQSGEIYMWQIPQGNCKVFPTNGAKCTSGVLLLNGTQLAAGYEDGSIRIFDLKTTSIVHQLPSDVLGGSITNLKLNFDGKLLIASGISTGAAIVKTTDCKVASVLVDGSEEIETAAFCPEADLPILALGSLNGEVSFWDVSRQAIRHKAAIGNAITNMIWGPNAMLFVSAVDGVVYVYSGRNGQLLATLTGHLSAILDMHLSKDNKYLLTSSDDYTAKVFDIQACCPVSQL